MGRNEERERGVFYNPGPVSGRQVAARAVCCVAGSLDSSVWSAIPAASPTQHFPASDIDGLRWI